MLSFLLMFILCVGTQEFDQVTSLVARAQGMLHSISSQVSSCPDTPTPVKNLQINEFVAENGFGAGCTARGLNIELQVGQVGVRQRLALPY